MIFYLDNALKCESIHFVPVHPENMLCGTIKYIQEVNSKNCCDSEFVTPIVIDTEESVEILAQNSSGRVYWDGGGGSQFTVTVHGEGFWLDSNYQQTSLSLKVEKVGQ